jgi:hypothetical protein
MLKPKSRQPLGGTLACVFRPESRNGSQRLPGLGGRRFPKVRIVINLMESGPLRISGPLISKVQEAGAPPGHYPSREVCELGQQLSARLDAAALVPAGRWRRRGPRCARTSPCARARARGHRCECARVCLCVRARAHGCRLGLRLQDRLNGVRGPGRN